MHNRVYSMHVCRYIVMKSSYIHQTFHTKLRIVSYTVMNTQSHIRIHKIATWSTRLALWHRSFIWCWNCGTVDELCVRHEARLTRHCARCPECVGAIRREYCIFGESEGHALVILDFCADCLYLCTYTHVLLQIMLETSIAWVWVWVGTASCYFRAKIGWMKIDWVWVWGWALQHECVRYIRTNIEWLNEDSLSLSPTA